MGFIAAFAFANFDEAQTHYNDALAIYHELADEVGIGMTTLSFAWLHYLQGEYGQATKLCKQAQIVAQETGVQSFAAEAWMLLGHLHGEQSQIDLATAAYKQSLDLRRENGQPHLMQECYAGLARIALEQDDLPTAVSYVNKILHYLKDGELHGSREPLRIYLSCYDVLNEAGDGRAENVLQAAYDHLQQQAADIDSRPLRYAFFHEPPIHERILMLRSLLQPSS
jgi:tetratricopeptide (TPR) repeat protein